MGYVGSVIRKGQKIDRNVIYEVNDLLTKHVASIPMSGNQDDHEMTVHGMRKVTPTALLRENSSSIASVAPEQVENELKELLDHCERSTAHPVITAAVAHFNFLRIHPFQHGNGRGARILMNFILQRHNLPPAVIKVEDQARYLDCLRMAYCGDILPLVRLVASAVLETMQAMLEAYEAESREWEAGSQVQGSMRC